VFETRVTRTTYPVKSGASLVEMAFDQGEIDASHTSTPLSEVELELKRGAPADLFRLAKSIARKAPLELTLASKAERGYRLLSGNGLSPVKAAPVSLAPEMEVRLAFQAIARACLRQLADNVPVLRQGDPEGLHQARVALRRLRAAISLFGDFAQDSRTEAIKRELKWITGAFGPAREMDVLAARAADLSQLPPPDPGAETGQPALRQKLEQKRRRAFKRAQSAVDSTRFRLLLIDLAEWIEAGEWFAPDDPLLESQGKRAVAQFAVDELDRRWKKIRKRGRKLRELDPLRRHKLRIQVKKTRYAAEFFAGAFPGRKTERRREMFLDALEPLQDCLGDLNDITVDRRLTAKLATQRKRSRRGAGAQTAFAAGELAGREEARVETVLATAEKSFDRFAGVKPFW
jgi:inorganic triphosphatase YgiF